MNAGMTNRKRFYKAVDISEAADGFSVLLDQRAVEPRLCAAGVLRR